MKVGNIIDGKWKIEDINERGGQGQVYKVSNTEYPDQSCFGTACGSHCVKRKNELW